MKQVGVQTNIKAGVTGSVGAYTPTPPTPPAPPSNPSAIVSGAGTAAANGVYTYRGTLNGKPYYNLTGQPDDPGGNYGISWDGGNGYWSMVGVSDLFYTSDGADVAFPWLATFIVGGDGDGTAPAPTVTQS